MKNQPNKAVVKGGLPTAERILNDHLWMGTEPTEAQSAILAAMQSYSDQQNSELRNQLSDLERENSEYRAVYDSVVKNRDELSGQLQSETESRKHWQRQAQRYQKYHKELNSALERVKELEARLLEISEIDEEDDIAWGRMKEIRADDYDLESEREEEIFQLAFFEGIKYVQKALKK